MEKLDNIVLKLDVHTNEICPEDLQEIMLIVKKTSSCHEMFVGYYDTILTKLWFHLTSELNEFDDQLLCCTCFYTVLNYYKQQEIYLGKALQVISDEILLKRTKSDQRNNTSLAVSLCYGMFQSSYLMQNEDKPLEVLEEVLKETFQLLTILAYEYSQYTFIVFKIMSAFKKVIDTPFQEFLFNTDNNVQLLNLVNHNWENPITGVRNLNRIIFQMLLLVLDYGMYEIILNEINGFYWNKAKFLMLTEIIELTDNSVEDIVTKYQWIHGLISSLRNPGLVSAGTDMYHAILKKLNSDNSWIKLYLTSVMKILTGTSFKAIENFSNYWCLTTFKKFPTLANLIINDLQSFEEPQLKFYSCLSVLKQANKLGLVEKVWFSKYNQEENLVLSSLEHCNASVRMFAFEIICTSQKTCLPVDIEYQVILKFLRNNVNSDCTVLRLSMLNSLAIFFNSLHISFLKNLKNKNTEDLCNLHNFCSDLQIFIMDSLNLNGNYQRKITTVKIAYLMFQHFNEVARKKQKQTKYTKESLLCYLKGNRHWLLDSEDFIMTLISLLKDPSTDVHDSVVQLFLEFYLNDISETTIMDLMIEEGLNCIKSKYFFEIRCGLNILKLIINMVVRKEKVAAAKFKNIEDIFYFVYNEIIVEYESKIDVVESIARGKQLHSLLSLMSLIFDIALKNSYQLVLSAETIFTLLKILKDVANQFVWDEGTTTSSDFSKMNDMVLHLIRSSNFDELKRDDTKISGLYQIVLNCLWLNVKASCELATILIQYYKENINICEESLNIITHVLETSRHKGAIEAAGASLGQGIRNLTSTGVESEVSKLPLSLLKRKLNELLFETTKMSSVTRRGAGLSIMVHRIVSNDAKKGKPLFQYFMKTILNTCNNSQEIASKDQDFNDENDLPKAIYIHFLTRIVTDSSLASDIMYYSAQLAELAFANLINPHWQIRNAALQLYGALIPKLIGQKKPSGTDDEIMSAVACDEFRTHSTQLWDAIVQQINNDTSQDIIQKHSNLVPLLNTLANMALRYNFSHDLNKQMDLDLSLLQSFFTLLGSPIYTVRRLTSMCIINIYPFDRIHNYLKKLAITSENHLHGVTMVIGNCYKVCSDNYKNQLDDLRNGFSKVLLKTNHSYLCQWSMEILFTHDIEDITIEVIKSILEKQRIIHHEPAAFLWINQRINRCLEKLTWVILPEVTLLLLNTSHFENYCQITIQRLKNSKTVPEQVLLDVSKILLSCCLKTKSSLLWEMLYNISHRVQINIDILVPFLIEQLDNVSYNMRYMVPFATRMLAFQIDNFNDQNLLLVSQKILILCNPDSNDTEMRYIAAIANNELAYQFGKLSDDIRINAIKSAVILLQDEDEDIRNTSVEFYKTLLNQKDSKHPFICLNEILKQDFLCEQLNERISSIQIICKDLLHLVDSYGTNKEDELNPFTNNSKNVYLEINVLQQLLLSLIKTM